MNVSDTGLVAPTKKGIITAKDEHHIVVLQCPACGEELERTVRCPVCGEVMKVISIISAEDADEEVLSRVEDTIDDSDADTLLRESDNVPDAKIKDEIQEGLGMAEGDDDMQELNEL